MTDTALLSRPAAESAGPPPASTKAPSAPKPHRKRPIGLYVRRVLRHVVMISILFIVLYPVLWMIVSSLRPDDQIFTDPSLVLKTFDTGNYTKGWDALGTPFGKYLLNSTIIVAGAVIGNLFSCSMAAYAFARLRFKFSRPAFAVMLLTIMIPIQVVIVPQYVMFAQVGLINTMVPLILPKFLATDSFFIFLMVQFIRGIPRELDEAARIDGCGHVRIFTRILLPLMKPALATTAIFTFIGSWNDFFGQLVYLTDPSKYTVSVALSSFVDSQSQSSYGQMFAMSVVSIVPVILAFAIGQKYLVQGIATTGGK